MNFKFLTLCSAVADSCRNLPGRARRSARAHQSPPVQLNFSDRCRDIGLSTEKRLERGASIGEGRGDVRRANLNGPSWWAEAKASVRAALWIDRDDMAGSFLNDAADALPLAVLSVVWNAAFFVISQFSMKGSL